jgi:hypothetical protein
MLIFVFFLFSLSCIKLNPSQAASLSGRWQIQTDEELLHLNQIVDQAPSWLPDLVFEQDVFFEKMVDLKKRIKKRRSSEHQIPELRDFFEKASLVNHRESLSYSPDFFYHLGRLTKLFHFSSKNLFEEGQIFAQIYEELEDALFTGVEGFLVQRQIQDSWLSVATLSSFEKENFDQSSFLEALLEIKKQYVVLMAFLSSNNQSKKKLFSFISDWSLRHERFSTTLENALSSGDIEHKQLAHLTQLFETIDRSLFEEKIQQFNKAFEETQEAFESQKAQLDKEISKRFDLLYEILVLD